MHLLQQISEHILDDTDLAGPVVFCLLLGACLLLTGKVSHSIVIFSAHSSSSCSFRYTLAISMASVSVAACLSRESSLLCILRVSPSCLSPFQLHDFQCCCVYAGLDFWQTCSVLGYCLLPVIFLATLGIVFSIKSSVLGLLLSLIAIAWSTLAATRLIDAKLHLTEQYWLVAYPVMLLYACFVLISIF